MSLDLSAAAILPEDHRQATLVGRVWLPGKPGGPTVVTLREDKLIDLSKVAATVSDVINAEDPVALIRNCTGSEIGQIDAVLANSLHSARDSELAYLLTPIDLQAIKACGVTFVESLLERVIEEGAKGDPAAAQEIRQNIGAQIGADLANIVPGSEQALALKAVLVEQSGR